MTRVGLTGGIGSGKSTVAAVLQRRGAALIDADAISRMLTGPGGLAIEPIREAFGDAFIAADGALDRVRMRHASYADADARRRLETIIHPLVGQESARLEAAAMRSAHPCIVFDIPLLVESQRWRQKVDGVLVVDCPADVQIRRVMVRSGLEHDAVQKIIDAQASRLQRLRAADWVLFNGGDSLEDLTREIIGFAHRFGL